MRKAFRIATIAIGLVLGSLSAVKADVLWDNGALITHPGAGFGGANASALMTSLGGATFGYGAQNGSNNRMADSFTISGGGWNITSIRLFTYQTGSTTTSTITGVSLRIFDGNPNSANVVYGSTTASAPAATGFTGIYRVLDTTLTDANRPIMFVDVNLGNLSLADGTYYLDFNFTGTLGSGPWAPPVSSISALVPGNALQSIGGGAYAPVVNGSASSAALPFIIEGSRAIPEPSSLLVVLAGGAMVFGRRRR